MSQMVSPEASEAPRDASMRALQWLSEAVLQHQSGAWHPCHCHAHTICLTISALHETTLSNVMLPCLHLNLRMESLSSVVVSPVGCALRIWEHSCSQLLSGSLVKVLPSHCVTNLDGSWELAGHPRCQFIMNLQCFSKDVVMKQMCKFQHLSFQHHGCNACGRQRCQCSAIRVSHRSWCPGANKTVILSMD